MSVKLIDLGDRVGLSQDELKKKFKELGFELKPRVRTVDDDTAQLIEDELKPKDKSESDALELDVSSEDGTTADKYGEIADQEMQREIIKSQRKKTAGKEVVKVKKAAPKPVVVLQKGDEVIIPETITVKEFSEKTGLNPVKIIGLLMKNGILANINQTIDYDTALIIADDFGIKLKRKRTEAAVEDISTGNLETLLEEKDEKDLEVRPPIVTVMGHVDHGKTKLLDAIRETDVVAGESGGITQHIGAYQVVKNDRKITFIDTPGHEAFTSMRARGAKLTDIVILVVAADEGVKPQTEEALNHAKDAGVHIIVALNKIDKEGINIDRVKSQLAEHGLQPEDWGGKTIMVPVSAITGEGIPTLLEMILLTADMDPLMANPNRPAVATVLEGHLDKSLGPVATVVVNTGTLHRQDALVIGNICGKVKTMKNHLGVNLQSAPPSTPVQVTGLDSPPHAGDILQVVPSLEDARKKAEQIELMRKEQSGGTAAEGLERIMTAIQTGKLKTLKVVLKADTLGTMEAIKLSLSKVKKDEVAIKITHAAVGSPTESDVNMAAASHGVLVAFNTIANAHVREVAARAGVQILTYQIIYKLIDDLKKLLSGLLEPDVVDRVLGHAEVKAIFMKGKKSMIVGCKVRDGLVENKAHVRILRGEELIGEGLIGSLKKINDVVKEVKEGNECGIKLETDLKIEEGDILEAWKEERVSRTIT